MKFLEEYRDPRAAVRYLNQIARITHNPWTIMEVCGGQTHAIIKHGIDRLLPESITLLHGPGCPVCVTPVELIDRAIDIASRKGVIFCSFGDMLRVPGSKKDLFTARAEGGDVRIVYSPADALRIAMQNPSSETVFFAIGFETTAPATAVTVCQARQLGIKNFSILTAHVLIPPAMEAILRGPQCSVRGFIAAGHVCTVTGYGEYHRLSEKYRVPIVVTGFEPLDILQGIYMTIAQLENGRAEVENQYRRAVAREGNPAGRRMISDVFRIVDRKWRGLGEIPSGGLELNEEYTAFDVEKKLGLAPHEVEESSECISGLILQGRKKPYQCPAFAVRCNPERPLGATMVSSEGACAAYYRYRRDYPDISGEGT
jgi:hydrogenase expression/formation protein HypD